MNDIPVGYSLTITSWENDADCYKDVNFYGLAYEDVWFLIDLAKLFKSMNNYGDPGFGGGAWHWKNGEKNYFSDVYAAIDEVVEKYKNINVSSELYGQWSTLREDAEIDPEYGDDGYNQMIQELVSYPEDEYYRGNYIRVFSGFTVRYYKAAVEDCTRDFEGSLPEPV